MIGTIDTEVKKHSYKRGSPTFKMETVNIGNPNRFSRLGSLIL